MKFTNFEYADFILFYGKANKNAVEAQRLYAEAFPQRRIPSRNVFVETYDRLRETGCVSRPRGDRNRSFSSENENVVLQSVEENPSTSVRIISRASHISKTKVHTILKRNKLYPFHLTPVQALNDGDSEKRLRFCNLIIEKYQTDDSFL